MIIRSFPVLLATFLLSSLLCLSQEEDSLAPQLFDSAAQCVEAGAEDCNPQLEAYISELKASKNDSIVAQGYLNAVELYQKKNFDPLKMIDWAEKGIEFLEGKTQPRLRSLLLFNLGVSRIIAGQGAGVKPIMDECMEQAYLSKDYATIYRSHSAMVMLYQHDGRIDLQIEELLKGKVQAELSGDSALMIKPIRGLASAYYNNEDYDRAMEYFHTVGDYYLRQGDSSGYYRNLSSWSNACLSAGDAATGLKPLQACVDFMERTNDDKYIPFPEAQLGRAFHMLGQDEEAMEVLQRTLVRCDELNLAKQRAYTQLLLSQSLNTLGRFEQALSFSGKALAYYEDQSVLFESLEAQEMHAQNLKALGRHQESLAVFERMIARKDSLMDETKMKEINRLQEELEAEKKELMICAQETEISDLEEDKRRITKRNIALLIGLVLSGIIAWLLVRAKNTLVRLRESENEKLELKLVHRNRELTSQALHLAQKNEILGTLKEDLIQLKNSDDKGDMSDLINKLRFDQHMDKNWDQFMKVFVESNAGFVAKLNAKHDDLSRNEFKLCAMLHMNLSSKDAAAILNVTDEAIKKARYRLRKKIGLNTEDSLEQYLMEL